MSRRLAQSVGATAFGIVFTATVAWTQGLVNPAKLAHTDTVRGDLVTVTLDPSPPNQTVPRITLERNGSVWDADAVTLTSETAGNKVSAVVTGFVPTGIPLGDYLVTLYLGKTAEAGKVSEQRVYRPSERLSVQPAGALKPMLSEFTPDHTYDIDTTYVPRQWTSVKSSIRRLRLAQPLTRNDRNQVTVVHNGQRLDVVWMEQCPVLRTGQGPIFSMRVVGRVTINDEQPRDVELCGVPADATIWVRGQQIAAQRIDAQDVDLRGQPMEGAATDEYRVMRLELHGSGFQLDQPDDNAIWINGERQTIDWGGCQEAAPQKAPRDLMITGEVRSRDLIRLCGIMVPADGQVRVAVGYGDMLSPTRTYRAFAMNRGQVLGASTAVAVVLALFPLALLSLVRKSYPIGEETYRFRMLFLDPETDTYSLSKFQFYIWTVAAVFGYAYLFISRVHVQNAIWPDVPGTLPGVIAVAGGTAVGSQIVTAIKGPKGGGEQKPSLADFITSGGVVAPDRLQMFIWTLFGFAAFLAAIIRQEPGTITELPSLPERLLGLMGLSSAGYLAGKMARKAGPVINEISVTPPESDEALSKAANAAVLPDLVKPVADADARRRALKPVTNVNAKAAVDALSNAIKATGAAHTTPEINALITNLATLRSAAETAAAKTAGDFTAKTATADEAQSAQDAAAALQELASDVTEAISLAASAPMAKATGVIRTARTIEIRGTTLCPEGLFEIDHVDLPFRMLKTTTEQNAPEVVVRDDTSPTMAHVLRLRIDPATLGTSDGDQFQKWFGTDGRHTLSITNLDGQKAEFSFELPPHAQAPGGTK